MADLPPLSEFLEEQLWAVQDRADCLQPLPLPEPAASRLAGIVGELGEAVRLLRRPTCDNRDAVRAMLARMRERLAAIEAIPCAGR